MIFGAGSAGLWLLDELRRRGFEVLLVECRALGAEQTIASQGIIHGGIKYTLAGSLTKSARAIRDMPALWHECLTGRREPDLREVRVLSSHCYLWRSESLKSKMGLIGARAGLRSAVTKVPASDCPAVLASRPGGVFRVEEPVIDTAAFVRGLAATHAAHLLKIDSPNDAAFATSGPGRVDRVTLNHPRGAGQLELRPTHVIFTAGAGNAELRNRVGLSKDVMQLRPLHMVMVRGSLPVLNGHCVDGTKTRATITATTDSRGRTVWLVGGQISEKGVEMAEKELIEFASSELKAVLPDTDFSQAEWATYRVDRAEGKTPSGLRPEGPVVQGDASVITAWPTKLALVPQLAKMIAERLGPSVARGGRDISTPEDWPRPDVALPPWEAHRLWHC